MLQEAPKPDIFGPGWRRNEFGSDEGASEISAPEFPWLGFPAKVDVRRFTGSMRGNGIPVGHADIGP